jgi:hypothetical protein
VRVTVTLLLLAGRMLCASAAPTMAHNRTGPAPATASAQEPGANAPATAPAQAEDPRKWVTSQKWVYELTPFLWFTGLSTTSTLGPLTASGSFPFGDLVQNLEGALMLHFEARQGNLALLIEPIYTKLGDELRGPGGAPVDAELKQYIANVAASYLVAAIPTQKNADGSPKRDGQMLLIEALAGARYLYLKTRLEPQGQPASSQSRDWLDPILGGRLRYKMDDRWSLSFRGDFGGFGVGSAFTWSIVGNVGYRLSRSTTLFFGYSLLNYDFESDRGGFDSDTEYHGPLLGATFRL